MAEYTAREWSNGDIITATNLSSIERGVSAMAEEYTPTTWSNGNTITAAALNKIEQGIADGSSSDLSTAEVTFDGTGDEFGGKPASFAHLDDGTLWPFVNSLVSDYETATYTCLLYQGRCLIDYDSGVNMTGSNVEYDAEIDMRVITGAGTITLSAK